MVYVKDVVHLLSVRSRVSGCLRLGLKTPDEITAFIEQRKKQSKDLKEMKAQVSKANYEQRKYNNLDFLYANNTNDDNSNN